MNKKDERLERSGLLCRIPVAVRTELGSDISLPAGGLSPESQCPRLLGEALVFTGKAPVRRPAGMAAAGPASLGRWHCLGLQWEGELGGGRLTVRGRGGQSMDSKSGGKDKKTGKAWWYSEAIFCSL